MKVLDKLRAEFGQYTYSVVLSDSISLEINQKELRKFDVVDPVKYDFALFGLGRYESF